MSGVITPKTIFDRDVLYQHLKNHPNQAISNPELCELLGLSKGKGGRYKRDIVSRHITALQKDHPNIMSKKDGYVFLDTIPADERILTELISMKAELTEMKTMVAGVVEKLVSPLVTGSVVTEAVTSDKPSNKRRPPKSSAPVDRSPLIAALAEAQKQGRPYTKTGRPGSNGIHARGGELPAPFCSIGRDRLERIIAELLQAGKIVQDKAGFLSVPCY
ncbi:hypothetical protein F6V30_07890 [Oryzomonas sagensis]|uniref:Uncharacterized protein n=1 Tax=Oryzomonas sagensis TaxID=2603857 RepID=A0ABQ6TN52_9BACT|nr:hypothetical protein [Oryzomonas sagensis]KAB0670077.1 hypothetical protein F6V30_07890 [Oryzomonas sagensis]